MMSKFAAPSAAALAAGGLAFAASQDKQVSGLLTRRVGGPITAMSAGPFGNPAHGTDYYLKCVMGGILSCGLTHTAVVPLDVVKCRMQVRARAILRPFYKAERTNGRTASSHSYLAAAPISTPVCGCWRGC
jgi:hypothetical protein